MPTKLVMIFEQQGAGWTESHVLDGTPTDFSAEDAKASALIPKRLFCSGKQTTLQFYKLIDTANPRRFFLGELSPALTGASTHDSDVPTTAALVRARSAAWEWTRFYPRGIWDDAVVQGGQLLPIWWGVVVPFDAYRQKLLSDAWGWTGRDRFAKKRVTP